MKEEDSMAEIIRFPARPAADLTDSDVREIRHSLRQILKATQTLEPGEERGGIRMEAEYALALVRRDEEDDTCNS